VYSAAEARFQIRLGCHLLDLSDDEIDAELERAVPSRVLRDPDVTGARPGDRA
jgi:hypothetical protein